MLVFQITLLRNEIHDNYDNIFLSLSDGIVIKLHVFPDTKFYCFTKLCVCVYHVSSLTVTQNVLPNDQYLFMSKSKLLCFVTT